MNDFDQAGRFQVKGSPEAHFGWLFPRAWESFRFKRWLDAQSAPRPGEPDRRCDTIAELVHREKLSHPRAAVVELFTRPDSEALDRSGEYLWRFRRELRHGPHGRDKYPFVAVLIFLTGRCGERSVRADLPGEADLENALVPRILEMQEQDAVAFLQGIGQNRFPAALLPWVPLMRHGQRAEVARDWLGLSASLAEARRRDAASLALTFSELTDSRRVWRPILEAVTVNESVYLREVRIGLQRENLVKVLRRRLHGEALAAAVARVEQESDLAVLSRWVESALEAAPEAILSQLSK